MLQLLLAWCAGRSMRSTRQIPWLVFRISCSITTQLQACGTSSPPLGVICEARVSWEQLLPRIAPAARQRRLPIGRVPILHGSRAALVSGGLGALAEHSPLFTAPLHSGQAETLQGCQPRTSPAHTQFIHPSPSAPCPPQTARPPPGPDPAAPPTACTAPRAARCGEADVADR